MLLINVSTSKETANVFEECVKAVTCAIDSFGPCVSSSLCQPLLPILYDQLSKFHHSCIKVLSTGDAITDAENLLENFTLGKKKRKAKLISNSSRHALISFPNFVKMSSLTLKTIRRIMSDTRVFITNIAPSSREGENVVDILSHTIDLTSVMIASLSLWHEQHSQRKKSHYHTLTTPLIVEMYDALLWTLLSTCNVDTQSPFLPHVVDLLRRGAATSIPDMVSVCNKGLLIMDSFLHPRAAPLYIPPAESIHLLQLKNIEKEERENRLLNYNRALAVDQNTSIEEKDAEMEDEREEQNSPIPEKPLGVRKERDHEQELEEDRVGKQHKSISSVSITIENTSVVHQENNESLSPPPQIPIETTITTTTSQVIVDDKESGTISTQVTTLNNDEIERAFDTSMQGSSVPARDPADDDFHDVDIIDEGDDPVLNDNADLDGLDLQF